MTISTYRRRITPSSDRALVEELRRVELALADLTDFAPQTTPTAPAAPRFGMIRRAIAPWSPLGTGDAWVWYDGTAWVAL